MSSEWYLIHQLIFGLLLAYVFSKRIQTPLGYELDIISCSVDCLKRSSWSAPKIGIFFSLCFIVRAHLTILFHSMFLPALSSQVCVCVSALMFCEISVSTFQTLLSQYWISIGGCCRFDKKKRTYTKNSVMIDFIGKEAVLDRLLNGSETFVRTRRHHLKIYDILYVV